METVQVKLSDVLNAETKNPCRTPVRLGLSIVTADGNWPSIG